MKRRGLILLAIAAGCASDFGVSAPDDAGFGIQTGALTPDYPGAKWAASPNFYAANRTPGDGKVKVVVIHTTQGGYAGSVSWLQNPKAKASAHYVISKTGELTQLVQEKDIAWHVGSENSYTIGIEHEGWIDQADWMLAGSPMWQKSVELTCYLVKKWGLPPNATAIKGHVQLPNQTHTDPGKYFDYNAYFKDVATCVNGQPPPPPPPVGCCGIQVPANGSAVLDDTGNDCLQKFGPDKSWWSIDKAPDGSACGWNGSMTYTYTSAKSAPENWARWRLSFAKAGKYKVEAWIPNHYASAKPTYVVHHAGQDSYVPLDQKPLSDLWADLGTYDFAANCDEYVSVGDNTGQAYNKSTMLGIDALRVTAVGAPCSNCDDGNPCTDDGCQQGACSHTPNQAACDDQDTCTLGEVCSGGVCGGGKPGKDCNDGNPCTDDGCKSGNCTHQNHVGSCSDGDPCNGTEVCVSGACKPGSEPICNDGNPCTDDGCLGGGCQHAAKTGPCDDGDACTEGDTCSNGLCAKGKPKFCDDGQPCTMDSCLAGGCTASPVATGGACDDGDGCTEGDTCANGICLSGKPRACDDGLDCTLDSCEHGDCVHSGGDPKAPRCAGNVVVVHNPCGGPDEQIPCLSGEFCIDGACTNGSDAAGLATDATGIALAATHSAAAHPSSCQAARTGPGSGPWLGVLVLWGLVWRRRLSWWA